MRPSRLLSEWSALEGFDAAEAAARVPDVPDVRTDGSLVLDEVTGVSSSGSGFLAQQSGQSWRERRWEYIDSDCAVVGGVRVCRGFLSVPGPLQTVQRAELWGVILALHSFDAVHLGVDDLNVVGHVARLLDGRAGSCPRELVNDGHLLLLIEKVLQLKGLDTVRFTKVKGHADASMVLDGRVREQNKVGNDAADDAADLGRRSVYHAVIDAKRNLSGFCGGCCHRFS